MGVCKNAPYAVQLLDKLHSNGDFEQGYTCCINKAMKSNRTD